MKSVRVLVQRRFRIWAFPMAKTGFMIYPMEFHKRSALKSIASPRLT